MKRVGIVTAGMICAGVMFVSGFAAGTAGAPGQKIDLKILYAGNPTGSRATDYVGFLREHFSQVETTDLAKFSAKDAGGFDVVMLDHDAATAQAPRPKFPQNYAVPTVTIGSAGAFIGNTNGLKTGYM